MIEVVRVIPLICFFIAIAIAPAPYFDVLVVADRVLQSPKARGHIISLVQLYTMQPGGTSCV